jgi:hypothetical protein
VGADAWVGECRDESKVHDCACVHADLTSHNTISLPRIWHENRLQDLILYMDRIPDFISVSLRTTGHHYLENCQLPWKRHANKFIYQGGIIRIEFYINVDQHRTKWRYWGRRRLFWSPWALEKIIADRQLCIRELHQFRCLIQRHDGQIGKSRLVSSFGHRSYDFPQKFSLRLWKKIDAVKTCVLYKWQSRSPHVRGSVKQLRRLIWLRLSLIFQI